MARGTKAKENTEQKNDTVVKSEKNEQPVQEPSAEPEQLTEPEQPAQEPPAEPEENTDLHRYEGAAYINLRTYPHTGRVIGQVKQGETVNRLERLSNGWMKVEAEDGTIGYCVAKNFTKEE